MALPPSAIPVLSLLATRGPQTHKQLVEALSVPVARMGPDGVPSWAPPMPARTLRYALARLREEGRVIEKHSFRDSRQSYYLLPTGDRSTEASGLLATA